MPRVVPSACRKPSARPTGNADRVTPLFDVTPTPPKIAVPRLPDAKLTSGLERRPPYAPWEPPESTRTTPAPALSWNRDCLGAHATAPANALASCAFP